MSSLVWSLLAVQASPVQSSQRVAVIGGGIGGGSFSYYWHKSHPEDEIIAFESRDYIGGRLKHVTMHGNVVEIGGDAWSTAVNEYVVELAKEMGNASERKRMGASLGDPVDASIGVWQGDHVEPLIPLVLGEAFSDLHAAADQLGFIRALKQNYKQRGDAGSFETVEEFVAIAGLDEYTSYSSADYFKSSNPFSRRHVSSRLLKYALEPLTRVIYDQNLNESHAFSSLVAVTAAVGADQFEAGNSVLVERLFESSGAKVHLQTTIKEVVLNENRSYTLRHCQEGGSCRSTVADYVIVACPLEHSDISFTPAVEVQPREWRHWFITVTRAQGLNPVYFGFPEGHSVSYENVLTTANSTGSVPFNVIQLEAKLEDGSSLWKFFSNNDLLSELPKIFIGLSTDPADTVVQHWPYTFPVLKPMPKGGEQRFMPITIGPNLIHLNTIESVASAMEGSIIAARNAALLLGRQRSAAQALV